MELGQGVQTKFWEPNPGPQSLLFKCPADIILYGGAAGGGKLASVDTTVYTPFGPREIGSLCVGDQVSNPDGSVARVIGVYPQGRVDNYRLTFSDGSSCEAGLQHLWNVREARVRRFRKKPIEDMPTKWRVTTTKELIQLLKRGKRMLIPLTRPVEFTVTAKNPKALWPVDPYVLGALIGDGHFGGSITLTSADKGVVAKFVEAGLIPSNISKKKSNAASTYSFSAEDLKYPIKKVGLLGKRSWEKFIPEAYKYAPVSSRFELMRGLMDTDGYVDAKGKLEYTTVSKKLAEDVQWLAWSLGARAKIRSKIPTYTYKGKKKKGRRAYAIHIQAQDTREFVSLKRKKERCSPFNGGQGEVARRLEKIEFSRKAESVCIQVDNPNGLYLTDDFIVTHNTDGAIIWAAEHIDKAGYHACVFRRTFPELERQVINRSRELFEGVGKYNERKHVWTFETPDGGKAFLEFAYLEKEGDVYKYQGAEFARIVWEESTMFSEFQIRYLFSRLRSKVPNILRQMLLTTNPVGPGFGWHKRLFIDGVEPLKITHGRNWPSDKKPLLHSICFIPAKVHDNPILLNRDPDYINKLKTQFGVIADALLSGSWDSPLNIALDIIEDVHFVDVREHDGGWLEYDSGERDEDGQVVWTAMPRYARKWMGIDWGKTDVAATIWFAYDGRRVIAYRDHCRPGREIIPYAEEVIERCKGEDIEFAVLSHECFADRGMGNTQADQFYEVFSKAGIPVTKSDKDPEGRLLLIREFIRLDPGAAMLGENPEHDFEHWMKRFQEEGHGAMVEYKRSVGLNRTAELPKMKFCRPTDDGKFGCPGLLRTLPVLVVDIEKPRKIADNQEDDPFDGLGYGLKAFASGVTRPKELILQELLDGRVPGSNMEMHLAVQEAEKRASETEGLAPRSWGRPRFGRH